MTHFQAFILGAVQGLTEFLPVSSSGHLVLLQRIFGLKGDMLTFDIAVHFATLLAILTVFWRDVFGIVRRPFDRLTWLLGTGTVPAVLVGLTLKKPIENLFESGQTLGLEFLATGVILWLIDSVRRGDKSVEHASYADSLWIGVAQAAAILPAISRSGLTIAAGIFRGLDRQAAARFSFLLAVPAILGAVVLDVPDVMHMIRTSGGLDVPVSSLLLGTLTALAFGFIAIKWMLRLLVRGSLRGFAIYVFALGSLVLVDQLFIGRWFHLFH